MAKIEKSIDVNVPVREAYNQWTQFESFPQFMDGVESVQQRGDTNLHWVATIAGKRQEWDAEITEQTPDQRIAWTSTTGDVYSQRIPRFSVRFVRILKSSWKNTPIRFWRCPQVPVWLPTPLRLNRSSRKSANAAPVKVPL